MDTSKLTEEQITAIIDKFPSALEGYIKNSQLEDALNFVADFELFVESLRLDERYKSKFNAEVYNSFKARLTKQKDIITKLKK